MMRVRSVLAALCLVMLGACWTGEVFYGAADLRPALAPGDYATTSETPQGTGRVRVTINPDGLTLITPISEDGRPDPGDAIQLGFAPLPGEERRFVAWLAAVDGRNLADTVVPYGLLTRIDGGEYRLQVPGCDGTEAIAQAAGAAVTRDAETMVCHFSSRATLEAALRRLDADSGNIVRLTPLPPRG